MFHTGCDFFPRRADRLRFSGPEMGKLKRVKLFRRFALSYNLLNPELWIADFFP